MPGPLTAAGFHGKLPARGDFVGRGLTRSFTAPLDAWLSDALTGSRAILGSAWLAAFLEAPIWRFALPPGQCGPDAAVGLLLPSVDRAGRYFPLSFAALGPLDPAAAASWLDICEGLGRAALERDATPEVLEAGLAAASPPPAGAPASVGIWWTEGSPRVGARRFTSGALPSAAAFAAMLDDAFAERAA